MRSPTYDLTISTARADALFASPLQRSDEPSPAQVHQAIAAAVAAFGIRGCAARVAQAYGEHPETAVLRMRWARARSPPSGAVRASRLPARGPNPGPRGPRRRAPAVEPERPALYRADAEQPALSPRIQRQPRPDPSSSAASTACASAPPRRPARPDDEPVLHQPVHERRVLLPPVLLPDRAPRIPVRPVHQPTAKLAIARP